MLGLLVLDALSSTSLAFWPHRNKHPLQTGARQWGIFLHIPERRMAGTLCVMWSVLLHFSCTARSQLGFVQRFLSQLVLSNSRHDAVHIICLVFPEILGKETAHRHHFKKCWKALFKGHKHWIKINKRLKWSWFSMSLLSPCRVVALPSWKTSFKSIWKLSGQWASALLVCR